MPRRGPVHPETLRMVERQLRSWEIGRAQQFNRPVAEVGPVLDFVTISNNVGAGGADIAETLSGRLGWPVFDKNILQIMAGDDEQRVQRYMSLDERTMGWLESMVRFLLDHSFTRNDYFSRLTLAVHWLSRQERCIFLGRFCDLILPNDRGIRIKVMAPASRCTENFAAHANISIEEARYEVQRIERERADFLAVHFRDSPTDYDRFDLLVNSERFTTDQCVEFIVHAMELRGCSISAGG
jgi:CMP/dCMP kinase